MADILSATEERFTCFDYARDALRAIASLTTDDAREEALARIIAAAREQAYESGFDDGVEEGRDCDCGGCDAESALPEQASA